MYVIVWYVFGLLVALAVKNVVWHLFKNLPPLRLNF